MSKLSRRERKRIKAGESTGYALGYAEGYAKGLHDGNPFNAVFEALTNVCKTIMSNPELMTVRELASEINQDRLNKLYGNDTDYAVMDDVAEDPEEV